MRCAGLRDFNSLMALIYFSDESEEAHGLEIQLIVQWGKC
jgi:hypothetical protein